MKNNKSSKKRGKKGSNKKKAKRIELSSKSFKINLGQIKQDLKNTYSSTKNFFSKNTKKVSKKIKSFFPKSMKNLEIKKSGNESHIILPKKYAGKKATVLIKKK